MCEEEVSQEVEERSSSLIKEEPQPPQIKEERLDLLQRPEEDDGGSTLTSAAVKREDDHGNASTTRQESGVDFKSDLTRIRLGLANDLGSTALGNYCLFKSWETSPCLIDKVYMGNDWINGV